MSWFISGTSVLESALEYHKPDPNFSTQWPNWGVLSEWTTNTGTRQTTEWPLNTRAGEQSDTLTHEPALTYEGDGATKRHTTRPTPNPTHCTFFWFIFSRCSTSPLFLDAFMVVATKIHGYKLPLPSFLPVPLNSCKGKYMSHRTPLKGIKFLFIRNYLLLVNDITRNVDHLN